MAAEVFFKTQFQDAIEQYHVLNGRIAPEETPYVFKYQGRSILTELIKQEHLTNEVAQSMVCRAQLHFILGGNFHDTEETNQAEINFRKSLALLTKVDAQHIAPYFNLLQELYNILGLIHLNRDDNETGLSLLGNQNKNSGEHHPYKGIVFLRLRTE